MAVICTLRDYIIAPVDGVPGYYWYWDKQLKALLQRPYASVDNFFELNDGSVIDVTTGSGLVALVVKASGASPINFIQLYSTSGDPYNILLSAKVVAGELTVVMYATAAKETTTITVPMQVVDDQSPPNAFTPCFNDYEIADDTILVSWCDAFTLNEVKTLDGEAVLVQTPNSVTCGYSAPIPPFRFTEEKEVEYRSCVLSNPVMFVWKNTLGGWDYWLFQKTNTETLDTESLGSFQKNYNRISDIKNPLTELGKIANPKIIYGANGLSLSELQGLKGMLISNKVYILNQDGTINRDVKIMPGTFRLNNTSSLEFQIEDVAINTIRN